MKFTTIWEPNKTCTLREKLGDQDKCETGIYVIKPEKSSNLSGVVEGCRVHLFKSIDNPSVFVLSQKQYGRPPIEKDENGVDMEVQHTKSNGELAFYGQDYSIKKLRGKPIMVPVYGPKPLQSIIDVDEDELVSFLRDLEGKI